MTTATAEVQGTGGLSRRRQITRALPTTLALTGVAAVWAAGAVWSFEEQTHYATSRGFALPELLPLVLDGLALSLAALAYAAALDGRAAVLARLGTLVAVCASAASNGAWAWTRTATDGIPDVGTVVLAAGVPIAANLAFEVLLSELRRQVQRRRGLPAPVPVPWPRLVRWVLAPWPTFVEWRRLVMDLTALSAPVLDEPAPRDDVPPPPVAPVRPPRRRALAAVGAPRARTSTSGKRARALALRAQHPEWTETRIAQEVEVHRRTVGRWLGDAPGTEASA